MQQSPAIALGENAAVSRGGTSKSVFWSRVDRPGSEIFTLERDGDGWVVSGTVLLWHLGRAFHIDYAIECRPDWTTRAVAVDLESDEESRRLRLEVAGGVWMRERGGAIESVQGALDVDLSFSPSTNTLPIRRLDLPVGAGADVVAAWVKVPDLAVEPLPQRYTRLAERRYRYESRGGSFTAEIDVDEAGVVEDYAGIWRRERPGM
jgi:hypothetical protein